MNIIWRRMEGKNEEKRKWRMKRIVEREIERRARAIERITERKEKDGEVVMIVEFEEEREAREIIKKRRR